MFIESLSIVFNLLSFAKSKIKIRFCSTRECISFVVWLRFSIHPVCAFLIGIRDQPLVAAVRWPPQTNTSLSLSFASLFLLFRVSLSVCLSRLFLVLTVKKLANGWTCAEMVDPPRRMFPECVRERPVMQARGHQCFYAHQNSVHGGRWSVRRL